MKRIIASALLVGGIVMAVPSIAMAHVTVKPAQVSVGAFESFKTGVPTEGDSPTVGVRVVIPEGLNYVSPNVKPGWNVQIVKDGETVKELIWTGGSIPAGQRDSFDFSAQVPAEATTINWKAYQTYENGTIVAWDQEPTSDEDSDVKPYSETKVVDDLEAENVAASTGEATDNSGKINAAIALGAVGTVLGAGALLQKRKA